MNLNNLLGNLLGTGQADEPLLSTEHEVEAEVDVSVDDSIWKLGAMIVIVIVLGSLAFFGIKKAMK